MKTTRISELCSIFASYIKEKDIKCLNINTLYIAIDYTGGDVPVCIENADNGEIILKCMLSEWKKLLEVYNG